MTADREIGTLTSTDGVRFTVADPLPVDSYYLWAGASGVRYAVDAATGTVKAKSYISYNVEKVRKDCMRSPRNSIRS